MKKYFAHEFNLVNSQRAFDYDTEEPVTVKHNPSQPIPVDVQWIVGRDFKEREAIVFAYNVDGQSRTLYQEIRRISPSALDLELGSHIALSSEKARSIHAKDMISALLELKQRRANELNNLENLINKVGQLADSSNYGSFEELHEELHNWYSDLMDEMEELKRG